MNEKPDPNEFWFKEYVRLGHKYDSLSNALTLAVEENRKLKARLLGYKTADDWNQRAIRTLKEDIKRLTQ